MSHIALRPAYIARPDWLSAARTWLRQARVAVNLPHQNVEDLSDRQLRDIGAGRRDIARAMDRETGRLGLLDIGWQRNRKG
ncbi:hypothetical protein LB524_20280 [Mesorhizobium sp. ESP6-5]|uniref:hypothetical protein n=1 Tax=unclassified Mesorhizobium TaxID=325217 RepID=UPI00112C386C|nr:MULTISPECIES: hypothetical protein [unclassified Mesorhizobium]MBZ9930711.1 hypothetical protein [Mesorhizobium sp. BR1-1-5]MBZ9679440.1 hypothetical protein [Mesorhizobium sp. CO1-1-2]MBZ9757629.1 hypothetical protein [Mesorhizobium sp. ESP6-5]MBZ9908885.1 hypothetical protein [Mesorhizobium sp. BR115XR7A]MBZ9923275.1 hypothetical protein [Mesorhizobium sp. BR1-1-4]